MSTFNSPTDVTAGSLAKASDLNNLDAATATAFALLPDESDIKHGVINFAADSGAANAYIVTLTQAPSSYVDGLQVVMKPGNSNTGASTINVNSLGVKAIKTAASENPTAGDINEGVPIDLRYSSTTGYFHMIANSVASANAAAASAAAAAASAVSAAASLDSFDDRYLGAKSSDPTLDNDGDALTSGAIYWNTASSVMKAYNGAAWVTFTVASIVAGNGLDVSLASGIATLSMDLKANGGLVIESTELAIDLGASSITGTLAVADGGTGVTTKTGTGSVVLDTSPTFTGPVTLNGGVVVNEVGADVDFRVESDTKTSAFIVDGEKGHIGFGGSADSNYVHYFSGSFTSAGSGTLAGTLTTRTLTAGNGSTGTQAGTYLTDNINTQNNSETIQKVAQLFLDEPDITKGATDTIAAAATLWIQAAPTEATKNWAVYVSSGDVGFLGSYSKDLNGATYRDLLIANTGVLGYDSSSIVGKMNVIDIPDTSWIYSLRPVQYEPKRQDDKGGYINKGVGFTQYGLIAEEAEKVSPDLVFYDDLEDGTKRVAGVHYGKQLVTAMLSEIQRLNLRVKQLEGRGETWDY